jgi:sulfur-carrier protein
MIRLLFFARLRENLGRSAETIELPPSVTTVRALTEWLRERGESWQRELQCDSAVRVAVNQKVANWDTGIADGDEVAFFPPVTGG